ncbi:MAG: NIPSNAP family protein, partial [Bryobacterales bacterium]|nr:NIPSNAP family protein [Bryobacterales bacterium]
LRIAGMPAFVQSGANSGARSLIEVRKILFRNTRENKRAAYMKFLESAYAPALKRAGMEAMGFFNNDVGPDKPHVLCVLSYGPGAAMVEVQDKLGADKSFQTALNEVHGKGPLYERIESSLFRAFAKMPKVEIPKGDGPMHFELRTYESDDPVSLAKKIDMFENGGEIAIFRKYGLQPVFFGEALIGDKIPNLTYMVAFPNAAARADAWRKFATSPEWDKLKRTPGLSDGEVVSSITNSTYSSLPFSEIR